MFALLHHGPPHCMAGQTHQTFTGSYCCGHHTLSFCSFHAQHQHHFMLNYVGNIKCVNNKMVIRIWNAKLVRAAIGINREYKAWIIKEIEEAQANGERKKLLRQNMKWASVCVWCTVYSRCIAIIFLHLIQHGTWHGEHVQWPKDVWSSYTTFSLYCWWNM